MLKFNTTTKYRQIIFLYFLIFIMFFFLLINISKISSWGAWILFCFEYNFQFNRFSVLNSPFLIFRASFFSDSAKRNLFSTYKSLILLQTFFFDLSVTLFSFRCGSCSHFFFPDLGLTASIVDPPEFDFGLKIRPFLRREARD